MNPQPSTSALAECAATAGWCCVALAQNLAVSLATLERHFQDTLRQSPRDWMTAERMRRARELLERRERIKDIAVILGYDHQRNFSTAFRNFHGYPPSLHRKQSENGGLNLADAESGLGRLSMCEGKKICDEKSDIFTVAVLACAVV